MPADDKFLEWMVTAALRLFMEKKKQESAGWLFDQYVETPDGRRLVKELAGFDGSSQGSDFAFEKGLGREDLGAMEWATFERTYWNVRPDARFWAEDRRRQLIVEAKGRGPRREADTTQAQRYFEYLRDSRADGAVIYLVPGQPESWLKLFGEVASEGTGRFGVMLWSDEFLRPFSSELIEVIAESLVPTTQFLKKALDLRQ